MRLKEYLDTRKIHYNKFAKQVNISLTTFYSIVSGHKDIRLSTAYKIEKATEGLVTCQDLACEIKVIKEYAMQKNRTTFPKKVEKAVVKNTSNRVSAF